MYSRDQLCHEAILRQQDLIEVLKELGDGETEDTSILDGFIHPDFRAEVIDGEEYDYSSDELIRQAKEAVALTEEPVAFVCKELDFETVQIDFKIIYYETREIGYRTAIWRLHDGIFKQLHFYNEPSKVQIN